MRATILQPNYIPWRGYFDFFKQSDAFIVYDDVQYTKNDWRNRNTIKTPDGSQWLTIPVDDKNRMKKSIPIKDIKMLDNGWRDRHIKILELNYKNAPYYGEVMDIVSEAFAEKLEFLVDLDMLLISKINDYLGIRCKIYYSSTLGFNDLDRQDRLVAICKHLGATEYCSGDAAKDYLDTSKFGDIRVMWHRYKEKVYPQLWGEFQSKVSILDLIANCGTKGYDII